MEQRVATPIGTRRTLEASDVPGGTPGIEVRPRLPFGTTPILGTTPPYTRPRTPLTTGSYPPGEKPTDTKKEETKRSDFETLADAFSRVLSVPTGTQDATPTVIMDPNSGTGSGMNIKGILILGALALAGWFVWKKWGQKAVSEAAS
jgi:hypothetical protein